MNVEVQNCSGMSETKKEEKKKVGGRVIEPQNLRIAIYERV